MIDLDVIALTFAQRTVLAAALLGRLEYRSGYSRIGARRVAPGSIKGLVADGFLALAGDRVTITEAGRAALKAPVVNPARIYYRERRAA